MFPFGPGPGIQNLSYRQHHKKSWGLKCFQSLLVSPEETKNPDFDFLKHARHVFPAASNRHIFENRRQHLRLFKGQLPQQSSLVTNTSIQKVSLYPKVIIQAPSLVNAQRQVSLGEIFSCLSHRVSLQRYLSLFTTEGSWTPSLSWLQYGEANATACPEREAQQNISFFSERLSNWHLHDHFKISAHPPIEDRAKCRQRYCQKLVLAEQQSPTSQSSFSNQIMRKVIMSWPVIKDEALSFTYLKTFVREVSITISVSQIRKLPA